MPLSLNEYRRSLCSSLQKASPLLFDSCTVLHCGQAIVYDTEGHWGCVQSFLLTNSLFFLLFSLQRLELIALCLSRFVFLSFYLSDGFLKVGLLIQGICPFARCCQIPFHTGCTILHSHPQWKSSVGDAMLAKLGSNQIRQAWGIYFLLR